MFSSFDQQYGSFDIARQIENASSMKILFPDYFDPSGINYKLILAEISMHADFHFILD